jgi:hypothetical protein
VENSQGKLSAWEAIQSVQGEDSDRYDSVCFEIEAMIDAFAAVLTMLSSSSMYKLSAAYTKI